MPYSHTVQPVYDEGDKTGFVYTIGLKTEYLALNVPYDRILSVASTMNFLSTRTVMDNETVVVSDNLHMKTVCITDEDTKEAYFWNYMTACDKSANIILLEPTFYSNFLDPENWGSYPPAPEGKLDLIKSIQSDLMKPGQAYIRHINGCTTDNRIANLMYVSIGDAMQHPEWKVDWVLYLNEEQNEYIHKYRSYFVYLWTKLDKNKRLVERAGTPPAHQLRTGGEDFGNPSPDAVHIVNHDDNLDLGYVYTVGGHKKEEPKLICLHVPLSKTVSVARAMTYLVSCKVKDNETIFNSNGIWLLSHSIKDEQKKKSYLEFAKEWDGDTDMMLLEPLFCNETKSVYHWGRFPPAPRAKDMLVDPIVSKWMEQGSFIRHIDGNTFNDGWKNLEQVDLLDALKHPEWTVDWDFELTDDEYDYVRENKHYFAKIMEMFREDDRLAAASRAVPRLKSCVTCGADKSEKKLQVCSRCRCVAYCSVECQTADWKKHKTVCKALAKNNNVGK